MRPGPLACGVFSFVLGACLWGAAGCHDSGAARSGTGGRGSGTGGGLGTGGAAAASGVTGSGGSQTGGNGTSGSGGAAGAAGAAGGSSSGSAGTGAAGSNQTAGGGGSTGTGSTGGTGGSSASGGAGGGSGGKPAVTCQGALDAASGPVVLAAKLGCGTVYDIDLAPTAKTDGVFVTLPAFHLQLASVSPGGVTVEDTGIFSSKAIPVLDASDAPALVSTTSSEYEVGYFVPGQSGWAEQMISPDPMGNPYGGFGVVGVGRASSGALRVLYAGGLEEKLFLADESSSSPWPATEISGDINSGDHDRMLVDPLGHTHIVYRIYGTGVIQEWIDGRTVAGYPVDSSVLRSIAITSDALGHLGVVTVSGDGLVVSFSDGSHVTGSQVIPVAPPFRGVTPCVPPGGMCQDFTCKVDQFGEFAIASTSDGAFWVAHDIWHFDEDVATTLPNAQSNCQTTLATNRSTEEIVLMRVAPDGSAVPTRRWSFSYPAIPGYWGSSIALAVRGSRLYAAFGVTTETRVFVLDWTKL